MRRFPPVLRKPATTGAGIALLLVFSIACLHRPTTDPNVIVVGVTSGPNNLDPRIGTDDVSAKASQLIFNSLMTLDSRLRVVPDLAERLDNPDPTTYVATLRKGVLFHDDHELTSADVVFTFRSLMDPAFISPRKGAYRTVESIEAPEEFDLVRSYGRDEAARLVRAVLDRLPANYGDALEWKYLEGHSVEAIGQRLGIGTTAAQSLLARARIAFREGLESVFGAEAADVAASLGA